MIASTVLHFKLPELPRNGVLMNTLPCIALVVERT